MRLQHPDHHPTHVQVVFLATANQLGSIPPPLLDRLEVIHLSGYTLDEKVSMYLIHQ